MMKVLALLRKVPIAGWLVGGLVICVLIFANPISTIKEIIKRIPGSGTSGCGDTFITGVKQFGKIKVYKRYVGGFLDLPADTVANQEDRKHFRVIYQWEGSAEFLLDLTQVEKAKRKDGKRIVLKMPPITIENLREQPVSGKRCVIKTADIGSGRKADEILGSISEIVGKKIMMDVDTPENIRKAREQAEFLVSMMFRAAKPDADIGFVWD